MPVPIRIIVADDHEIFRDGIAAMFRNNSEIELINQASNGAFLVAQVAQHRPDVVLTDIQMDTMNGIEATRIIKQKFPETVVIAMSMYDDNFSIIEMLAAGATGYLVKNATKQVIIDAIRAGFAGENFYCRTTSEKLAALISTGRFDPKNQESLDFTPTELRIIRGLCDGMDGYKLSEELSVSYKSMEKYRSQIMEKACVKSTAELIVWAIRNGVYRP